MSDSLLTVTDLDGNVDLLTKFNGFEMHEELNGALKVSFSSFSHPNNPGHNLIVAEGIVGYEGFEFRIKQLKTTTLSKQVAAISTYFDNVDTLKYDVYGGTHTLTEFLSFVLNGTGWTFINEDVIDPKFIPDFGRDNVVKLIDILKAVFECEMKIEPNKVLRFAKKIGSDNDDQYRYGHNIVSISENVDTTKLKTHIEGFGKNGIHVTYTSPLASKPGIGIRHAEPIYSEEFANESELLEYLKIALHDYPDSTIELDVVELQDKGIGDRVWVIHERLGIEYQTRVMSKKTKIPKSLSSVVLGNTVPTTLSSILSSQKVEIDNNRRDFRSSIRQVNDEIELKVSLIDYNGEKIVSMINLAPDSVKIQGRSINLVGAVTVLSDITGNLGTLTAGTIDANKVNITNLVVGGNVQMGPNAKISWANVTDQPTIIDANTVTTITRNTISTSIINANQVNGGKFTAFESITIGNISSTSNKSLIFHEDGNPNIVGESSITSMVYGNRAELAILAAKVTISGYLDGVEIEGTLSASQLFVQGLADVYGALRLNGASVATQDWAAKKGSSTDSFTQPNHNHGIPNGTRLLVEGGGSVVFSASGGFTHSHSQQ